MIVKNYVEVTMTVEEANGSNIGMLAKCAGPLTHETDDEGTSVRKTRLPVSVWRACQTIERYRAMRFPTPTT